MRFDKYASIDGDRFLVWRYAFKTAVMILFHKKA